MNKQRKATDVLLDLEIKVDTILTHLKNQENLMKVIANRLGVFNKSNEVKQPSIKDSVENLPTKPIIPGLKPGIVMTSARLGKKEDVPTITSQNTERDEVEAGDFIEVETNPKGKRRTARYAENESTSKKTAVQQKITYADGKNVCLASVEIYDLNNNLIKQAKTNAMGKWMAALDPAEYIIKINKHGVANKPNINLEFQITIPNSDRPLELDPPEL